MYACTCTCLSSNIPHALVVLTYVGHTVFLTLFLNIHCNFADTDEPVPLSLPNQWLWDIIDEFIYQVGFIHNASLS